MSDSSCQSGVRNPLLDGPRISLAHSGGMVDQAEKAIQRFADDRVAVRATGSGHRVVDLDSDVFFLVGRMRGGWAFHGRRSNRLVVDRSA